MIKRVCNSCETLLSTGNDPFQPWLRVERSHGTSGGCRITAWTDPDTQTYPSGRVVIIPEEDWQP